MPTVGADCVGCALITILADATEVHPAAFVTVAVYVFAFKPDMVVLEAVPEVTIDPGLMVTVHVPEGNPLNATLPVATAHVG